MGRMDIVIDNDLEKKFRQEVAERLGFRKGNLSQAIEEAVKDWIEKNK